MSAVAETIDAETEIRELVDHWAKAVHASDVAAITSHYAPEIVAFDAVARLRFRGIDAYRAHWQACLAMCPGPMIFEIRDLDVVASGDVGFSFCLLRCGIIDETGQEKASWMRLTTGYRLRSGKWQIMHEHCSEPFDMTSNQVLFDLAPD